MIWFTGNVTSTPDDGRCFLECDNAGHWCVYRTGDDGRLLPDFPKLTDQTFGTALEAQAWVEENVPPHPITKQDIVQAALANPDTKIVWADSTRVEELQPWVDRIFEAARVDAIFVSDKTCMIDLIPPGPVESQHAEIADRLGIEFDLSDYVTEVARRVQDQEP